MDGGKGQLSSAVSVLESMDWSIKLPWGLAKQEEELFLPGQSEPIVFAHTSGAFKLITAIRDEAHRFAITYHRSLRERERWSLNWIRLRAWTEERKACLLKAFGSIDKIAAAGIDDLAAADGVDIGTARSVYKYFHDV